MALRPHFMLPLICLPLAAGCSGGGAGSVQSMPPFSYADRLAVATLSEQQLGQYSATAWGAMPAAGQAVFTGAARLTLERTPDQKTTFVGASRLVADFTDGTMTGRVDNLIAVGEVQAVGEITIGADRSIIGDDFDDNLTNRPNDWYADYTGDLRIGGDNYQPQGNLQGQFIGARTSPSRSQSVVRGIIGRDDDGFAVVNGRIEEVPAPLEIFAQN